MAGRKKNMVLHIDDIFSVIDKKVKNHNKLAEILKNAFRSA